MSAEPEIKRQVREFYDQVGWQQVADGVYQNAHYDDLRPVSQEYIHNCHLRVGRHLNPGGKYLLDAGSGPIQYPEYLEYSKGYKYRLCADISKVALQEARKRIGEKGLFVVCDIAHLPFKGETFDGLVSLHTIHHLPSEEHSRAYFELYRVLGKGKPGVVVNGWSRTPFTALVDFPFRVRKNLRRFWRKLKGQAGRKENDPKGTFVEKNTPERLRRMVGMHVPLEILVWRSVSVRFLRTFIHEGRGGRTLLRWLYDWEERYPRFFGENGYYPLIVIRKPDTTVRDGANGPGNRS